MTDRLPDKIVDRKILVLETYSDPTDEASKTKGVWTRNHLELSVAQEIEVSKELFREGLVTLR